MNTSWKPTRRDLLCTAGGAGSAALVAAVTWPGARPASVQGQLPPHARPEEIGIDPRRLQLAYRLPEDWTTGNDAPVPGGAIIVGRRGRAVAPRFFGRQGPERDATPIRAD